MTSSDEREGQDEETKDKTWERHENSSRGYGWSHDDKRVENRSTGEVYTERTWGDGRVERIYDDGREERVK